MQQTSFEFLVNEETNEVLRALDPEQRQRLIELMAQAIVAALRRAQGAHDE
jgi:uncharacterized tellurite resistance protein B-like protein